ncbi:MAG TPA: MJ0042-type zinc finger domain-containing protein [Caulobacteraceae bacterium]|nr:MJ0042-type zinc finger domain-containing protein [Caulobacteraceae bacterium]
MILTCPECATRYFVEDDRVGEAGRSVRCASCGAKWTARAEPPLELTASELGAVAEEPRSPLTSDADDGELDELGRLAADELPRHFRGRAQTKEKVREAAASGAIWAGLIAGFLLLIGGAVLMRQDIATMFPRAAGAFAMAGLPVNVVGLTIEDQHAQPALKGGHAVLSVSGSLHNVRDHPIAAPPLKISILNNTGRVLAVNIADPGGASIPPGESRGFAVDVVDPPVGASDVEITFAANAARRAPNPQPRTAAAQSVGLRPAAPAPQAPAPVALPPGPVQNAQPLPAGSKYALPESSDPVTG